MTAKTPVYGLEYLVQGEPARATRLALENNAKTIEAALVLGGVATPGAQDLLQVSGRVSTLEADRVVAPLGPFSPPFLNNWGHLTPAVWDSAKIARDARGYCVLTGNIWRTDGTGVAAGATSLAMLLPPAYRPRRSILRQAGVGGNPQGRIRVEVRADGNVAVMPSTAAALPAGEYVELELSWWAGAVTPTDTMPTAT